MPNYSSSNPWGRAVGFFFFGGGGGRLFEFIDCECFHVFSIIF